ncbi:cation diffusion facilitator family transporter [Butyrivibrio sp. TB]|uniref:cation diffusion facilitator family transporter n=1 Tax=Butyrivibrio sp. TB TaxID=1520809 RepID=UPI0008D4DEBA|nr:cation diffusion facilitator family transporter [Butyrivibrio sp. TB]SEQ34786.1 cation diffusion facilitator family transporter [Butyrivibrio sp. TB]
MIQFLAGICIKDHKNYNDANVRRQYGILCGAFGVVLNIILVVIKSVAALMAGSVSILADAANNLSDAQTSIVTIIGFKLASQKPDKKHPFGHGRIEYVAGLIVAFFIFGMAIELLRTSVKKILAPERTEFNLVIAGILMVSILIKLYMFVYNKDLGKKISSAVLVNNAKDSISDVVSTSVVLFSSFISNAFDISLDGYAGTLVACFIFYQAFEATRDTISPLLGEAPSEEMIMSIEQDVLQYDKILGVHDIVVHNYGPSMTMMSLHVEISSDGTLLEAHDLVDEIEQFLNNKYSCSSVIHVDPVDFHNEEVWLMREKIAGRIRALGPDIRFHDFRIIHHGVKKIIAFDIVVPFDYDASDDEVREFAKRSCMEMYPGYDTEVTVDKAEILR